MSRRSQSERVPVSFITPGGPFVFASSCCGGHCVELEASGLIPSMLKVLGALYQLRLAASNCRAVALPRCCTAV